MIPRGGWCVNPLNSTQMQQEPNQDIGPFGEIRTKFNPNDPPGIEPSDGCVDENIGYLPMSCPNCTRHRVEAWLRTTAEGKRFVVQWRCEKCRTDRDWEPRT